MPNEFKEPNYYEHTIADEDGSVVGHVRIKPNRILWKSSGWRAWRGVSLEDFAEFMEEKGRKQKQ